MSLAPTLTMAGAAAGILGEQSRAFKRARAGARHGEPDAVHDLRVATRRIREALRVFADSVRTPRGLVRRLKRAARAAGRVRDRDVMIALLAQRPVRLGPAEQRRLTALVDALARERRRAQRRLRQRLTGRRGRGLTKRMKRFRVPLRTPDEDVPVMVALSDALTEMADDVAREPAMMEVAPSEEALHRLRIAFKRLRYSLEFHADAGGLAEGEQLEIARGMQDCLGELHDMDVLLGRLAKGKGPFRGPWPHLLASLGVRRLVLLRRFARLRRRWRSRTAERPAESGDPRFVALEPAPVQLRLVTGSRQIASAMIR